MADRPDLRQIAVNIAEALESYDREQLAQMLTYVFKEYVVEGPPSVLVSQVDGMDALSGLNFAELIEQLQARLDVPELEHFAVRDGKVSVRVGGVMTPIAAGPARATPAAPIPTPAAETPTNTPQAAPRAGVGASAAAGPDRATAQEAFRRGRGDLAGGQRGIANAPAPRGGVSINSRPSTGSAPSNPAPASASVAPAQPSQPAASQADAPSDPEADGKPPAGDDDASVRFSLLELD